jgi:DNA-binding HxlR family transcriptional regulator
MVVRSDGPSQGEDRARPRPGDRTGAPRARRGDSPVRALDRLVHERVRLGILSVLAVNDVLTFSDLKTLLQTTDGNLSVHARKLEEAQYVTCTKSFAGRVPKTEYRLTASGRRALEAYLDRMESLIKSLKRWNGVERGRE